MTTSDETELAVRGEEPNALERRTPGTPPVPASEGTGEPLATRSDDGGSGDGDQESGRGGRRRRPLRTVLLIAIAVAVAATAGMAASGVLGSDGESAASAAPSGPPATTKVQRTTLTDTETVDGNLSYGDATDVQAPAASGGAGSGGGQQGSGDTGAGVITWLPSDGVVLERGDTVYRVGQEKVPLLYGSIPLYRTLETGNEGEDVKILEKNLKALGYTGFTVDDTYTSSTAEAVEDWQEDLDREETGTVQVGDAVVASGPRRVAEVKSVPGALLSGSLLSLTGTSRVVNVDLDPQFEDLVKEGTKATVTLPDDTTVEAVVTDIGTPPPAQSGSGGDAGQQPEGGSDTATIPVQLKIKEQKKLGRYQAAQVDVVLKAETREDVLAVPVNALTAQRGGYALEAVTDKGVEYVPVKLGMFAGNLVEVTGAAVKEGMVVGVPK
ncbi:peptidoglycan-binding protein [Streptomyces sp. NBC_01317]|uniref:peptidoglycan-binding protein n=1 Tax=Streptomyces sp. NBC_01317 TaxID=2903822 RepID=UPI002E1626A5|nr:peptidoglycan-binding protein [Streptomyces sp. NBC_01317]